MNPSIAKPVRPSLYSKWQQFIYTKTYRISLAVLLVFYVLAVIYFIHHYKEASPTQSAEVLTITNAKFAKSNTTHRPELEDTKNLDWQITELPHIWSKVWRDYDGVVWYRLTFSRPAGHLTHQDLFLRNLHRSGTFFLNGQKIGETSINWPPTSTSWYEPQLRQIPEGLLSSGENTLDIAVWGMGQFHSGIPRVEIGDHNVVEPQYQWSMVITQYSSFFVLLVFASASLVFLFLWLSRRDNFIFLFFAANMVAFGLVVSNYFSPLQNFIALYTGPYYSQLIPELGECFTLSLVFFVTCHIVNRKFPRIEKLLLFISVVFFVNALFSPPDTMFVRQYVLNCFALVVYSISGCLMAWYCSLPRRPFHARIFLFFGLCIPVMAVWDLGIFFEWRSVDYFTATMGGLIIHIFYGVVILLRFMKNVDDTNAINALLDQRVEKMSQELAATLEKEHVLQLSAARLNERMQLWSDIHDGFGGALSSTIAQLENTPNIPNSILTMFKGLYAELRLIMQTGSEEFTTLEKALVEVRRQMISSLEAVGMEPKWVMQGNPQVHHLIALHLPLIVREALVNVLKHSQAKVVLCLFETQNNYLRVHISDDGIGSDVSEVSREPITTSLSGLGINSMKRRAQKISADFQWSSGPNGTIIRLNVPLGVVKQD